MDRCIEALNHYRLKAVGLLCGLKPPEGRGRPRRIDKHEKPRPVRRAYDRVRGSLAIGGAPNTKVKPAGSCSP